MRAAQIKSHEASCAANQKHCDTCGGWFQKREFSLHTHCKHCGEGVPKDKQRSHELQCPSNTKCCEHCGVRFQTLVFSYHNCRAHWKQRGTRKPEARAAGAGGGVPGTEGSVPCGTQGLDSAELLPAEAVHEIEQIRRELRGTVASEMKGKLRRLQLQWHPDKARADASVAHFVFHYVQSWWDHYFK